ncbi:MAG: hypothetical protein HKN33_08710 [Pyrinomonadaceae bacterium]|nr:hypothetical protein [Pyrinomonadaceae bacterium]
MGVRPEVARAALTTGYVPAALPALTKTIVISVEAPYLRWNLEPGTWNLEPGTWNREPGTWNLEPEL